MLLQVLLALLGLQLLDLVLLIAASKAFGFVQTLVAVLGMGLVGGVLARREGRRVWGELQASLAQGRAPEHGVIDTALVLLAGVLMLLPGILSDVLGAALCIPPLRHRLAAALRGRLARELDRRSPSLGFGSGRSASAAPGSDGGAPEVIETTGVEASDEPAPRTRLPSSTARPGP